MWAAEARSTASFLYLSIYICKLFLLCAHTHTHEWVHTHRRTQYVKKIIDGGLLKNSRRVVSVSVCSLAPLQKIFSSPPFFSLFSRLHLVCSVGLTPKWQVHAVNTIIELEPTAFAPSNRWIVTITFLWFCFIAFFFFCSSHACMLIFVCLLHSIRPKTFGGFHLQ